MTIHLFCLMQSFSFFFFNDTATTEIYTLSLHDALPISDYAQPNPPARILDALIAGEIDVAVVWGPLAGRSEEHTSELQSRFDLVCRLLLEKKKKNHNRYEVRYKTE